MSALTGGPEDNSFGAKARVYTISPVNGDAKLLAKGLAGAVGLAVAPTGDVFVAELFGNRIVAARATAAATPHLFRKAKQPAAVEWSRGTVYATTNVLAKNPAGRLVRFGG